MMGVDTFFMTGRYWWIFLYYGHLWTNPKRHDEYHQGKKFKHISVLNMVKTQLKLLIALVLSETVANLPQQCVYGGSPYLSDYIYI
jgi:hypothetical protein